MGWKTIRKYLDAPAQGPVRRDRPSKLDPFKGAVAEWLEKDPGVSAAVIEQKLRAAGYQGGHSILREYVRNARPHLTPKRAFVRMEPLAGERFEVDWGHFGALSRGGGYAQRVSLAARRRPQPDVVCRVPPQPELGTLRPLPHACVPGSGWGRPPDRLRQSGHRRCRARRSSRPLPSAIPRLR